MLIEGLKLTLKNIKIMLFPILTLIIVYLLIVAAILAVVPFSQLSQVYKEYNYSYSSYSYNNYGSKNITKVVKKFESVIYSSIQKNFKRAIVIFLLFGLLAVFLTEFLNASLIVAARDIVVSGHFSFKSVLDEGMIFTPQLIVVDILCSFGLLSVVLPVYIAYYVTGVREIILVTPIVVLFVLPVLIMPRYVLVVEKGSAINAVADGVKVALKNYPIALLVVLISGSLTLLSSVVGVLLLILGAFSSSLLGVWMSQIAVREMHQRNAINLIDII